MLIDWEFLPEHGKVEMGRLQGQSSFAGGKDRVFSLPACFLPQYSTGVSRLDWAGYARCRGTSGSVQPHLDQVCSMHVILQLCPQNPKAVSLVAGA